MKFPKVSFVVPCYKLAHLLTECVQSILAQTYGDFEVLIMDDCSPDNTAEVAASFRDDRVIYIRNEQNLGHLLNYNKGIGLARGKYIWLISPDDYLRKVYILERYVEVMEANPQVGYVFCPGFGVRNSRETGILSYSSIGNHDRIMRGRDFLQLILDHNLVVAASAMVRHECYDKVGVFPVHGTWAGSAVDYGWNGDWYLWCMFAMYYDVAYLSEPMVCYRDHDLSFTESFTRDNVRHCSDADIGMLWVVRQHAIDSGQLGVARECLMAIAKEYARHSTGRQYRRAFSYLSIEDFEDSLCRSTKNREERNYIRARFYLGKGDGAYTQNNFRTAGCCYLRAIRSDPSMLESYAKLALLGLGKHSRPLRSLLRSFGNSVRASFLRGQA